MERALTYAISVATQAAVYYLVAKAVQWHPFAVVKWLPGEKVDWDKRVTKHGPIYAFNGTVGKCIAACRHLGSDPGGPVKYDIKWVVDNCNDDRATAEKLLRAVEGTERQGWREARSIKK